MDKPHQEGSSMSDFKEELKTILHEHVNCEDTAYEAANSMSIALHALVVVGQGLPEEADMSLAFHDSGEEVEVFVVSLDLKSVFALIESNDDIKAAVAKLEGKA